MQSLMSTEIKKPTEKRAESVKIETRFYDELFMRLQDKNSEEFKDPEAVESLFENIIDQITESREELIKCLNSFHIDYFIYRANIEMFLKLFKLMVVDNDKLEDNIGDRRISRSYEACLTCMGEKFIKAKATEEQVATAKECIKALGNHLVKNFDSILDTENGIFTLRAFLRIIGDTDPLEPIPNQQNRNKKKQMAKTRIQHSRDPSETPSRRMEDEKVPQEVLPQSAGL